MDVNGTVNLYANSAKFLLKLVSDGGTGEPSLQTGEMCWFVRTGIATYLAIYDGANVLYLGPMFTKTW